MPIDRLLVTGAAGFLGHALLRELIPRLERPDDPLTEIHVLDVDGERLPAHRGIKRFVGTVTDAGLVTKACDGVDAVFHCASLVDWGNVPEQTLRDVNVGGTSLLLDAARRSGVRSFVYTSSMDVVCGPNEVVEAVEQPGYPARLDNVYCETKAEAEELVLRHDDPTGDQPLPDHPQRSARMRTVALRPCGMYGEADPYHVKHTIDVVRSGRLVARPGDGSALFEHVYVGNVAHAHVEALRRVDEQDPDVCGQAFFVTDDTPRLNFFEFMEPFVEAVGLSMPPRDRRVPYGVMWTVGLLSEAWGFVGKRFGVPPPVLTRSSVRFVCKTHTFDGGRARRAIGYVPKYSHAEALERTLAWLREHALDEHAHEVESGAAVG